MNPRKKTAILSFVFLLLAPSPAGAQALSLTLESVNHATVLENNPDLLRLKTSGNDPYVIFKPVGPSIDSRTARFLIFEYRFAMNGGPFQVFIGPGFTGANRVDFVPSVLPGEWGLALIDLSQCPGFSDASTQFRLDTGNKAEVTVELKGLRLGEATAELMSRMKEEKVRVAQARLAAVTARGKVGVSVGALPIPNRTMVCLEETGRDTAAAVVSLSAQIDLDAQVKAWRSHGQPIARGPRIAAGQGPHPENYTFIRVLTPEGIPEVGFLAFPPSVRGGVEVCAVRATRGMPPLIIATPLLDKDTGEIRFFTRGGALWRAVPLPPGKAPWAMGVWKKGDGSERVAVVPSGSQGDPILLFTGAGERAGEIVLPDGVRAVGDRALTGLGTDLALQVGKNPSIYIWDGTGWKNRPLAAGATGKIYPGRLPGEMTVPGGTDLSSTLTRVTARGVGETVDAGTRENLFWIAPIGSWGKGNPNGLHYDPTIASADFRTNRYLRRGAFHHARVEPFGTGYGARFEDTTNERDWRLAVEKKVATFAARYDEETPILWEPTTSHRWPTATQKEMGAWQDGETGLPKYLVASRLNTPPGYAETTSSFTLGSYHYQDQPFAFCHWTYPLREHLRALALRHRANPEHFIACEPVHEMEVISEDGKDGSIGDYNPAGLRSFFQYLRASYPDLGAVNRAFGTAFTPDFFDAPRDLGRGPWDVYDPKNPFFQAWWRFNMQAIYRVVSDAWREALLAGFPPEALTCHQIPDLYAISSLTAFSKPVPRVTPVDWMLTAGTAFGYTRYGLWYKDPHSMQQSAWSSGHGMTTLGEYAPLSTEAAAAEAQYRALFETGAYGFHLMAWNPTLKPGVNKAAFEGWQRFSQDERPRPGISGGVLRGEVFRRGDQPLEIISIGTGPDRTGLLKSVRADGTWEGSVYSVPFHSAISVRPILSVPKDIGAGTSILIPEQGRVLGGSQIEIRFDAEAKSGTTINLLPTYGGLPVQSQSVVLTVPAGKRRHLVVVKVPLPEDAFSLTVACGEGLRLGNVEAFLEEEQAARPREGIFEGVRAKGGVTFAVVE